MEEIGIVLSELSCRTATELTPAGLFSSRRTPAGAAGKLRLQFSSQCKPLELALTAAVR